MSRKWPSTIEEFNRLEAAAVVKYRPLVSRLSAPEVVGLHKALGEALDELKAELKPPVHIGQRS